VGAGGGGGGGGGGGREHQPAPLTAVTAVLAPAVTIVIAMVNNGHLKLSRAVPALY